jgi:GT2 family glycosyltransferase
MSDTPAISVIMATYGEAPYLQQAVESILHQTFADFELIIINNGVSRSAQRYLASREDPRIRIIANTENLGLTHALNQGIAIARGAIIARMDDDDISLPERLAVQKDYLDLRPHIAGVGTSYIMIDELGATRGTKGRVDDPALLAFLMVTANQFVHPSIMVRAAAIREIGGYDEEFRFAQDYDLWSRMIEYGFQLANINTPLIQYRVHDNASTKSTATHPEAYRLAQTILRRSMSQYITLTDDDFRVFTDAFHRRTVASRADVERIQRIWRDIEQGYLAKHTVSDTVRAGIHAFVVKEQKEIERAYQRSQMGPLGKTLRHIKRFLRL